MIEVGQRWRDDCLRCCVASVFEVPYEAVESIGPSNSDVVRWVGERFPDVKVTCRHLTPFADDWKPDLTAYLRWPREHSEPGHWVGTIWSPRIPDELHWGCGCASRVPGGDPDCEWCHGKPEERFMGCFWGLHAVVMLDGEVAWDPHPEAEPGQDLYFCEAMTFEGLA